VSPALPDDWKWASTEELCGWLGIDVRSMYWLRSVKKAPRGYRVGKGIRYRRGDVETWLASRADS
jgi:predicted DNA-binding transcriptional regulator AlpA